MASVRKIQSGVAGVEGNQGGRGSRERSLVEKCFIQDRQNVIPLKSIHTLAQSSVNPGGQFAYGRSMPLDITENDAGEKAGCAASNIVNISALPSIGRAAVDAGGQSGCTNIVVDILVAAPNSRAVKIGNACRVLESSGGRRYRETDSRRERDRQRHWQISFCNSPFDW